MGDRFKFKAVLKTSEFTILVEPYYILEDSYFIDITEDDKILLCTDGLTNYASEDKILNIIQKNVLDNINMKKIN